MYQTVSRSSGKTVKFSITVRLKEGYGDGFLHRKEEVIEIIQKHLADFATNSEPYLTGIVQDGTVVYAWQDGSASEPVITYHGNSLQHQSSLSSQ